VVLFSFVLGDFPVAATLVERLVAAWQSPQLGGEHGSGPSTPPGNQNVLQPLQEGPEGSNACTSKQYGRENAGQVSDSTSTPAGKENTPHTPQKGHQPQEGTTTTTTTRNSRTAEGPKLGAWPRLICIADRFPVKELFQVPPELPRVTVHVQHEGERRTWLQGEGRIGRIQRCRRGGAAHLRDFQARVQGEGAYLLVMLQHQLMGRQGTCKARCLPIHTVWCMPSTTARLCLRLVIGCNTCTHSLCLCACTAAQLLRNVCWSVGTDTPSFSQT
jgi:hypothetical protein